MKKPPAPHRWRRQEGRRLLRTQAATANLLLSHAGWSFVTSRPRSLSAAPSSSHAPSAPDITTALASGWKYAGSPRYIEAPASTTQAHQSCTSLVGECSAEECPFSTYS